MAIPKVSIIMATKNSAQHIAHALDSITAQSFQDYEIIIVDAHSTDQTLNIAARYSKIQIVQQSGVGFADAWNCGIERAQGIYICFLDSDDIWNPEKLALQTDFLERNPSIDCIVGRVLFFADKSAPLPATFRPELLQQSHVARMPGTSMFRRSLFTRVGLFDPELRVASDIDWFVRIKDLGIGEAVLDQIVLHKRVHQSNLSYTGAQLPGYDREVIESLRRSIFRKRKVQTDVSCVETAQKQWPPILMSKREAFVSQVNEAITQQLPFAAGKISVSEQSLLTLPLFLSDCADPRQRAAFYATLRFHAGEQIGVFPTTPEFLLEFSQLYLRHLRTLDSIGLFRHTRERELIARHGITGQFVNFEDQEPDRSVPADEENCYLPACAGKRVLLVSPFASILCRNATRERFEAVWGKTGKPWFNPAAVLPLEFPFGVSLETRQKYSSILEIFDQICKQIDKQEFDVAMISAGGLNIPIASYIKSKGKVALALGGHLQVVFGVLGKRWRARSDWMERYVTDAWSTVPEEYRPVGVVGPDQGAYW